MLLCFAGVIFVLLRRGCNQNRIYDGELLNQQSFGLQEAIDDDLDLFGEIVLPSVGELVTGSRQHLDTGTLVCVPSVAAQGATHCRTRSQIGC